MPRQPFDLSNIIHLLEYLVNHSRESPPNTVFNVRMTLRPDEPGDFILDQVFASLHAEPVSMSFRCKVSGVGGVAALFEESPYGLEKITWQGLNQNEVILDCVAREVHVLTDSIAFLELCRHRMIGQGVRKFTADLKIQ